MIRSFADERTRAVFEGRHPKGFPANILRAARRKFEVLEAASSLDALRSPPGNKLHALVSEWIGQHAIRINDQFRLCFRWTEFGPEDVEIVDCH